MSGSKDPPDRRASAPQRPPHFTSQHQKHSTNRPVSQPKDDSVEELRALLEADIERLAEALLGAPNQASSSRTTLRFGTNGGRAVEVHGPNRGLWYDHETGAGGGPFDLICTTLSCDFPAALSWAREFTGTGSQAAASLDVAAMLARDAERKAERERKQAEAERDQAQRIATARGLWDASKPIGGTVAETYLTTTRGIPRPAGGWPDAIRFYAANRSLILAGTDSTGAVQFVHRVRLTADGRKHGELSKVTNGPMAGAYVRLPGPPDGPLQLAEGPETGLSVWAATGAETWLSIGSMARHEPPPSRSLAVCQDDDSPRSPAGLALGKAVDGWRAAGSYVAVATPWQERRHDKSDFNDVLLAGGIEAVRARINAEIAPPAPAAEPPAKPHFPRPHLSGEAASARLRWTVAAWLDRVELHLEARDWISAEADRLRPEVQRQSEARILAKLIRKGADPDEAADQASERAGKAARGLAKRVARKAAIRKFGERAAIGEMPRIQIKGAAGLGKTQAVIAEYLRRPALWQRHLYVFAKTLELGRAFAADVEKEFAKSSTADGSRPRMQVLVGRQEPDMCKPERLTLINAALQAGATSIQRACCHTPAVGNAPESFCPFYDWCKSEGYQSQFTDKTPALWVMAHARLGLNQATDLKLPPADLVIVDESAISDLETHATIDPALLTDPATYSSAIGAEYLIEEAKEIGKQVLAALLADEPVTALSAGGCEPEHLRAAAAAASLGAEKDKMAVHAGMKPSEALERIAAQKKHQGRAAAAVFSQLARDLEAGRRASIGIEWDAKHQAALEDGARSNHPIIRLHGLKQTHGAPAGTALMLLDADASLSINRRLFGDDLRGFTVLAVRRADVTQVSDWAVANSSLLHDERLPNNQGKAAKLRAHIAEMVRCEVNRDGGQRVLIITPLKVRRALTGEVGECSKPTEWNGAVVTHIGRHLGANDWADFDTVIVLGRQQLPPIEAERAARAIYANAPDVVLGLSGGKYKHEMRRHDLRAGTAPYVKVDVHPDKLVQDLVEIHREQAMGQALDRLRLIHRTVPARALVVSNIPVPGLVVDRLVSLTDMLEGGTVWERAMARMPGGVLPLSAKWLVANLPDLFPSERTAEREAAIYKPPLGNRDTYCRLAVYKPNRQRNKSKALIRADVADPARKLAALLGVDVADFRWETELPPAAVPWMAPQPVAPPAAPPMPVESEPMPGLDPAMVYRRGVLELPPATLLTVRGHNREPVALIEVPDIGGFMCASVVTPRGLGVPLVMRQAEPADGAMPPGGAFWPAARGAGIDAG
jgi:hypothetical protein